MRQHNTSFAAQPDQVAAAPGSTTARGNPAEHGSPMRTSDASTTSFAHQAPSDDDIAGADADAGRALRRRNFFDSASGEESLHGSLAGAKA